MTRGGGSDGCVGGGSSGLATATGSCAGGGGSCLTAATWGEWTGGWEQLPCGGHGMGGWEQLPCGSHERGDGRTGTGRGRSGGVGGRAMWWRGGGDPAGGESAGPSGEPAREEPADPDPTADCSRARSAARRALRAPCDGGRFRLRAASAACEREWSRRGWGSGRPTPASTSGGAAAAASCSRWPPSDGVAAAAACAR